MELAVAENEVAEPQNLVPVVGVEADEFVVFQCRAGVEALGVGHVVLDKVDLHVEMLRHGDGALRRLGDRFLCRRFDALHRLVGVQGGDAAAPTLVHGDGGDGGNQRFGKVAQRLVAGEQCHGDAVVSGSVGVDEKFTAQRAVEENMVVPAVHGVAQRIAGAACPGVVAGKEYGVEFFLIHAAHHA